MNFIQMLNAAWRRTDSMLCVGLDPEPARFPPPLTGRADTILEFCRAIVDATAPYACAFKPQIAYFSAYRAEAQLEKLLRISIRNTQSFRSFWMRNAAILAARRRSMRAKHLNATALMRSRCIPIYAQFQSRRILRIRIKGSLFYAAPPMRAALRYSCKERGMLTFTRSLHSARLSSGMRTGNWAWSWAPLFPKTSLSYAGLRAIRCRC